MSQPPETEPVFDGAGLTDAQLLSAERLLARRAGETMVLVDVETGNVFELNGTAARFWEHLRDGASAGQAARRLAEEFAVSVEQVAGDLQPFLQTLRAHGLLTA